METECQALNRSVTPKECAEAQKELPRKFCEGCDWVKVDTTEFADTQQKGYTPFTYTIRLSHKLRSILIEEAKKQNIQPREYIVKFLAEKLLK